MRSEQQEAKNKGIAETYFWDFCDSFLLVLYVTPSEINLEKGRLHVWLRPAESVSAHGSHRGRTFFFLAVDNFFFAVDKHGHFTGM